jgi:hypothetical protein
MSAQPEQDFDTVVMKFGGSSVADADKIKNVARRMVAMRERGTRVVGTVSAMGKTTDGLIELANQVSADPVGREMDMLLSTGERISCALVAMAIHDLGYEAVSLTGSQAGIETDAAHTKAKITKIRADRVVEALDQGKIVLLRASRASRPRPGTSPPSAAAAPTPPRSPWPPPSARPARSTRTWPASTAPTRASSPTPASSRASPTTRCSRCRRRARRC